MTPSGRAFSQLLDPSQPPLFQEVAGALEWLEEECWHPSCRPLLLGQPLPGARKGGAVGGAARGAGRRGREMAVREPGEGGTLVEVETFVGDLGEEC